MKTMSVKSLTLCLAHSRPSVSVTFSASPSSLPGSHPPGQVSLDGGPRWGSRREGRRGDLGLTGHSRNREAAEQWGAGVRAEEKVALAQTPRNRRTVAACWWPPSPERFPGPGTPGSLTRTYPIQPSAPRDEVRTAAVPVKGEGEAEHIVRGSAASPRPDTIGPQGVWLPRG